MDVMTTTWVEGASRRDKLTLKLKLRYNLDDTGRWYRGHGVTTYSTKSTLLLLSAKWCCASAATSGFTDREHGLSDTGFGSRVSLGSEGGRQHHCHTKLQRRHAPG